MYYLTSALVGGEWSASQSGRFTPRERAPGTHCLGTWNRSGHGGKEKKSQLLPGLEPPIIQSVAQRCTTSQSVSVNLKYRNFLWKHYEIFSPGAGYMQMAAVQIETFKSQKL